MTIDERLERLVDRHEALTQSVEMLTHDMHQMQSAIQRLDVKERKGREAILQAIVAYLKAHNGEEA